MLITSFSVISVVFPAKTETQAQTETGLIDLLLDSNVDSQFSSSFICLIPGTMLGLTNAAATIPGFVGPQVVGILTNDNVCLLFLNLHTNWYISSVIFCLQKCAKRSYCHSDVFFYVNSQAVINGR